MTNALILVDLQNDFMPTGALPVPHGDEVIAVANQIQEYFDLVIASQDWHPADHESFVTQHAGHQIGDVINLHGLRQELWPVHCVQNSHGAEFVSNLDLNRIYKTHIHKGVEKTIDSYSAFFDNGHQRATGLHDLLQQQQADNLYIMGLATDYCVKFTVLDALQLGYKTYIIIDGCRGIELKAGDVEHAIEEMRAAGAVVLSSAELNYMSSEK